MSDLIDRQAAIDALEESKVRYFDRRVIIGKMQDIINGLPSVQPEPKKGKWIVFSSPDEYYCGLVKCPFCSEELIAEANEYNYCPNCGADMRGEE